MPERSEARKAACKAASKELYHERRQWGVCTVCGKPRRNGETTSLCVRCLEKRAIIRQKTRVRINERSKARRDRFKQQGLCIYCGKPAVLGQTQCEYHRNYYAEINKASYERNKAK